AAAARQRAQRAAAKRAQAARAAARKARANKAPKAKAKPKSQPKPKSKPSQKSKPTQRKTNKVKEEAREQAKDAVSEEAQAQSCEVNSFVPGTKVLMADGSKKPIEDVRTGDKVLATDPKTGETKPQPVAATIIGKGDKTLVTVTIRTTTERAPTTLTTPPPDGSVPVDATQLAPDEDGEADEATSTIVATDGHPFWVPELNTWLDAGQLQPGQWLHTSAGTWVQITAVSSTTQRATVHNLTVADVHTYYAVAGAAPVLVHNCGGSQPGHSELCKCDPEKPRSEVVLDAGSFEQARNRALDIVGPIDTGSWQRRQGTMASAVDTFGRDTGFTATSGGQYRSFRLDTDPRIGPHINVMTGKGAAVRKWAIRFPGGSGGISTWLRRNV
ncbi:polymorphic toxin-type HINT domain-containing protein, partial [Streptomyces albidoflavus]